MLPKTKSSNLDLQELGIKLAEHKTELLARRAQSYLPPTSCRQDQDEEKRLCESAMQPGQMLPIFLRWRIQVAQPSNQLSPDLSIHLWRFLL